MPFLPPNQQHQSTEGKNQQLEKYKCNGSKIPFSFGGAQEELGAIGVFAGISHRQDTFTQTSQTQHRQQYNVLYIQCVYDLN